MRQKQRTKSWIKDRLWINPYWHKLAEHPGRIFLEQDLLEDKTSFLNNFNNIICEFGSGSGAHLIELAKRNPQFAVVGFELRFKRVVRTVEKAKREGVSNLFVICGYAQNVLEIFKKKSVSHVYINFPDPWEKKVKNRLVNAEFLSLLKDLLVANGKVNIKTDHKDYFYSLKELLKNNCDFTINYQTEDLHAEVSIDEIILTEFEKLFLSQNLKIYALELTL